MNRSTVDMKLNIGDKVRTKGFLGEGREIVGHVYKLDGYDVYIKTITNHTCWHVHRNEIEVLDTHATVEIVVDIPEGL